MGDLKINQNVNIILIHPTKHSILNKLQGSLFFIFNLFKQISMLQNMQSKGMVKTNCKTFSTFDLICFNVFTPIIDLLK